MRPLTPEEQKEAQKAFRRALVIAGSYRSLAKNTGVSMATICNMAKGEMGHFTSRAKIMMFLENHQEKFLEANPFIVQPLIPVEKEKKS